VTAALLNGSFAERTDTSGFAAPTESEPAFLPGLFEHMPAETYHAIEALSATGSKKILQSPAHFKLFRTKQKEPSAAMQFGTAVHGGVLEPDRFDDIVCCAPEINKRTKDGKAEYADFLLLNQGKVVLSAEDLDRARRCVDAVLAHPAASELLAGGKNEHSLFWNDARYKVPCKARYDTRNHGGIVDLKTAQDASPEGFGNACARFLYHVQGANYWSGHEHVLNESPAFFAFIAVESEEPYAVGCYSLTPVQLAAGERLMAEALARYAQARETGIWPGYSDAITELKMPRWSMRFDA
jgi:hypothetical protein